MNAPLTVMIDAWLLARQQWQAAAHQPAAGNFDTPECEFWRAEMDRHEALIEAAPIRSQHDAAAMIRFIWMDSGADDGEAPQVRHSVLASVKKWAEMA